MSAAVSESDSNSDRPSEMAWLLHQLDQAFERKSWHGPNLRGSLRGVTAAEAAWRPGPSRHSIWEQALHAAYWKYAVRRRIRGEAKGSFPLKGSNWFARPEPGKLDEASWKADLKLLSETHRSLREAVAGLAPELLPTIPAGSATTFRDLILGIAFHDVYHAGQIQLLKRLQGLAIADEEQ